ncbi:hypothetical protein GOP47_0020356 [Adiantum capillus-veneris]|uniref:Pentatricopeptide repeat-containing protein n=1 Tax=Adiantum capillus-veneris TaxID=13818 RepID=A0A9D4UCW4_ADICA|nr:hypothetical protein GOP47_0020356 [Adiantum capillus-veneris]
MSVVRQWARKLSRRRIQLLLVRWISVCSLDAHECRCLKHRVSWQGSIMCFERRTQQERGYFPAALLPTSNARLLCSSAVCLNSVESAIHCLTVGHEADPLVNDGIASTKVADSAQVSSQIASIDVHAVEDHQSVPPVEHDLHATDGHNGALQVQENAGMEVENGLPQASVAAETIGNTRVTDEYYRTCKLNDDTKALARRVDLQELTIGLKSDDEEDDLQESLGEISGSSKTALSSEDRQLVEEICTLLDSKGWNVNVEEFMGENYAPRLSHAVVAMVIHRLRRLHVAKSFFEWACRKLGHARYCYHALLWKMGLNKQYDEAWEIVDRMRNTDFQPNETTFCILIKAFGATRNLYLAFTAFKRMNEDGVVAGTHTFTALLSVFFKLQLVDEVHLCYSKMIVDGMNLDIHLFSTLICGFGTMGKMRDAQACFHMMLYCALKPDLSIYYSLILGFCRYNAMHSAMSTFDALQKSGLQPSASTFNVIIKAFCKVGKLEDAMSLFAKMKGRENAQPNQATYNILLQGMFVKEEFQQGIDLFKQMEREGFVDSRSYIYLSNGLRKMKQTQELLEILRGLFDLHGFSNTEVCNALIYNLSHLKAFDEAEQIFRGMVNAETHANIPSYAVMISSYCRAQKVEAAIELLAELRGRDCIPSSFCYTPIISLLLRKNRATEALRYLYEMETLDLGVNLNMYEDLLKVTCKQGMIEDAIKVCDEMMAKRFTVSTATLFELMKCLTKLRSIEFATSCFRKMYEQQAVPDRKEVSQALAVMNLYTAE